VIGDAALLALEHRKQIEERVGKRFERDHLWLDMAAEWRSRTGLPWVAAFWAARPESLSSSGITAAQLTKDLTQSRDNGLLHIDDLVMEWTPRIALRPETIHEYLSGNIYYRLDEECIESVKTFFKYAAECGVLPEAPPLRFL
jgi:chorismate dehydratase